MRWPPNSGPPAAMSDFELISSALPPGSDVPDLLRVRGVMVESGCGAVAVGSAYLFPPLSSGGASIAEPYSVSTPRSSNRTGAINASGSRTSHHTFAHGRSRAAIRPTARAVIPQRTPIGSIARQPKRRENLGVGLGSYCRPQVVAVAVTSNRADRSTLGSHGPGGWSAGCS